MKKSLALFFLSLFLIACDPEENTSHEGMQHSEIESEQEFLEMMIPHHQEAIDTAQVILEKSENAELIELAEGIVEAQTMEISQMQNWGEEWYGEGFEQSEAYTPMMPNLNSLEGEELDQAFIAGMVEHHQGAIEMAEQVKMVTDRPEVLELADAIIEAQSQEIQLLESWLK